MRKKASIYTRGGDKGTTSLANKCKVSKSNLVIEALGSVDELNSLIGLMLSYASWHRDSSLFRSIQDDLFVVGSILSGAGQDLEIDEDRIAYMEEKIDFYTAELPPLKNFIIPGGEIGGAWLHYCRSVCRRAEREIVRLNESTGNVSPNLLIYMNRLSDLMFVCARRNNKDGTKDVIWSPTCLKAEK